VLSILIGVLIAQTHTDSEGTFTVTVPAVATPVAIVASQGQYTDEASGKSVALTSADEITTVLTNTLSSTATPITPMTTLVADRVLSQIANGTVTQDSFSEVKDAVSTEVAQLFGVEKAVIEAIPNAPNNPGSPSSDEGKAAFIISAFSQYQKDNNLGPDSSANPVASLKELSKDFQNDGQINGSDNGTPVAKSVSGLSQQWSTGMVQATQNLLANPNTTSLSSFNPVQTGITSFESAPTNQVSALAAVTNEQVTVCHVLGNSSNARVTMQVPKTALAAHLAHGDTTGKCAQWTAITNTSAPVARRTQGGQAIWTGSKMFVWGDTVTSMGTNTGGLYDPTNDSWTATSLVNAPTARTFHTTVWTGSKVIIWGGITTCEYTSCYLNSGAIFDPKTNSWTAISSDGAPEGRYFHSAVWTGSKMIVWGGTLTGSNNTNTGGIYDLKTNSWSPMSTINAPDARTGHLAVWTGTKMIIWAGLPQYGTNYTNTGGVYDPITDSWEPTSIVNAPTARLNFSSVWTGTKMLIWGGWDSKGLSDLNSGALYDPITDTWTPTSMTNAPEARQLHATAWTGSKMVIWGGRGINITPGTNSGVSFSLNSGAFYDPKTDLWEPIITDNSPKTRWGHFAAWTGTDLIVWGGTCDGVGCTLLNDGGRYSP